MQTVLMVITVVKDKNNILIRRVDPEKNPYNEPWALFGGRILGVGTVNDLLNEELKKRWSFTAKITEKLWWDEDIKIDHDNEEKRFVYIDAMCEIIEGEQKPINKNEKLEWVAISDLSKYEFNPPSVILLKKLNYIN